MARTLALLLALGLLASARADEEKPAAPAKAPTPGHGVILLKQAWEAGDLDGIVGRYAEPGASHIRSDLAALRRIEENQRALAAAITEKLGAGAAEELVSQDKRVGSPLVGSSVILIASKVKSATATTKFRIATREGERFFRYAHALAPDGDWKIVLTSLDGVVCDEKALRHMAVATAAHERAADELARVTGEVRSGALAGKDAVRKRIVQLLADEKRTIDDDERGEKSVDAGDD